MEEKGLTVADALALQNKGNGNGSFGDFGGNSAWWVIILILFFGMAGRGGWGGGYGGDNGNGGPTVIMPPTTNNSSVVTPQCLSDAFNFNGLQNDIRAVDRSLADHFYATNLGVTNLGTQIQNDFCATDKGVLNGFATTQNIISQGNIGLQGQINTGIAALQATANQNANTIQLAQNTNTNEIQSTLCNGFNGIQSALAQQNYNTQDCCCRTREAITQNGFDTLTGLNAIQTQAATNANALQNQLATNACDLARGQQDITYAMNQMANNLMQASERNTDRIINHMVESEMADLRNELATAKLQISQAAQTNDIINQLQPVSKPCYLTNSPYTSINPYGLGNGCGCNMS